MTWTNWIGPTLAIAIGMGALSVGALYQRVATVESAGLEHDLYHAELARLASDRDQRLARLEIGVINVDKQLDKIEAKIDRMRP